MTKSRAALIILLAVFVLALHVAGIGLELYGRVGWYHWIVHTLAGAVVALAIMSIGAVRRLFRWPLAVLVGSLLVSLVVGVLWEVFEIRTGIDVLGPGYAPYTAAAIISDLVGGLLAGVYLLIA